ncbi:helix-turn-helix domain-containing protein [Sanguibacter sp. 25GB23B1]|uniref:helix-turn-helix transcriptional regulator n=1 Tax=unclassified Sanguibacter TaxID=2645534 RepID=UPI0032B0250B
MSDPSLMLARSMPKLGTAIKRLRTDRGLTQAQLADAAGVSRQWVVAVESGTKSGVEIGLVMHLLDTLDASLVVRDDRTTDGD